MKRIWIIPFLLVCLLTGCTASPETEEPQALALVLGHHDCFPQISQALYEEQVYEAAYSYGQVSAVISDGQPELAAQFENRAPGKRVDEAKHEQLAQTAAQTILAQLSQAAAQQQESDTLGAIHVAVRALQASGMERQTLMIVDSGLSTGGLLNFAESNLLEAEPETVVEALRGRNSLPDLRGIAVIFLGLGQTAGAQSPLDAEKLHKLQAIWQAVLEAGEPERLVFDPTPLSGLPGENLPQCSTVELVSEQLLPEPEAPLGETPVRLSSVQFHSDTSEFLDEQAAAAALEPVGAYLADNPDAAIWLAGMTASTGGTGESLSLARAEACKSLLLELGASDGQIRCVGLGRAENFLRVNDLDETGTLIEAEAAKNRAVFLFAQQSETAKKLNLE